MPLSVYYQQIQNGSKNTRKCPRCPFKKRIISFFVTLNIWSAFTWILDPLLLYQITWLYCTESDCQCSFSLPLFCIYSILISLFPFLLLPFSSSLLSFLQLPALIPNHIHPHNLPTWLMPFLVIYFLSLSQKMMMVQDGSRLLTDLRSQHSLQQPTVETEAAFHWVEGWNWPVLILSSVADALSGMPWTNQHFSKTSNLANCKGISFWTRSAIAVR